MALENPFYLDIAGRTFGGWLRVRLERSIDQATTQWGVNASRTWPGQEQQWWIEPGDRVNVRIYDHLICSGWIDAVEPNYDGGQHVIQISGRGLVADLCDCSYVGPPWQWKSVDPSEIIRTIAAQHQIKVNIAADLGEPLKFQVQQGETCWDAIERIARLRQCLAYEEPDGSLIITRGSEEYVDTPLVQGELILAAQANLDDKDRYSHYIVKGQQKSKKKAAKTKGGGGGGGDEFYDRLPPPVVPQAQQEEAAPYEALGDETDEIPPEQASFSIGEVRDPSVRRYRPLLLVQSANTDNGNALDRASWEMQNRWGKARKCEITLGGWLQPNGELWPINRRCEVLDDWLGLDRDLAITAVSHDVSNSGLRTVLTLQPPEALTAKLPKKAKDKGGKKGGKGKGKAGAAGGGGGPNFYDQLAYDRVISEQRRKDSKQ